VTQIEFTCTGFSTIPTEINNNELVELIGFQKGTPKEADYRTLTLITKELNKFVVGKKYFVEIKEVK
jgi:hypothetical protein